jgi:ABC-type multidrug transport system ATPase subunit
MSISAPYIELIEEFTLEEMISFHRRLKPLVNDLTALEVTKICKLEKNLHKHIKVFSSGMKQRVKLALAILSDTPMLLLDEPTSNLDQAGIDWYIELVNSHIHNRAVVVSSNSILHEYSFCKQIINLEDFKKPPVTDPSLMLF